jgi:hypothetical protein
LELSRVGNATDDTSDGRPGGEPTANEAVADFRFWRRVMVGGWLLALPSVALGTLLGVPFLLAALPAPVAFAVGMLRAYSFLCPRCGRSFVISWWWQNVFTNRCVHCGHSIRASRRPTPGG